MCCAAAPQSESAPHAHVAPLPCLPVGSPPSLRRVPWAAWLVLISGERGFNPFLQVAPPSAWILHFPSAEAPWVHPPHSSFCCCGCDQGVIGWHHLVHPRGEGRMGRRNREKVKEMIREDRLDSANKQEGGVRNDSRVSDGETGKKMLISYEWKYTGVQRGSDLGKTIISHLSYQT